MFASDLLLAFAFMALLFLRQIFILKQPNKINYAPLMIGIGAISSVVHFIIHPDTSDIVLLLRESFFPLLVALLLYIVMNILHQTQISENARNQEEFSKVLVHEISELKKFILELENRMSVAHENDRILQHEMQTKFKEDIQALDSIRENQMLFIEKFDDMELWHKDVNEKFEHFSKVQLPELDAVVNKHIEILRVSEQEHYNKLVLLLDKAVNSRVDISEDISKLMKNINSIKTISDDIAKSITKHTIDQLSGVTKAFEKQILALKQHTEGIKTSLYEGENTLGNIRSQSEMIMQQIKLSASKMEDLQKQNSSLYDVYGMLKEIILDVENVKSDYVKAQSQLSMITTDLTKSKDINIIEMQAKIDELSEQLEKKIDESLAKLHEHYHIAGGEITQSVQMLAKRAQLKKGYGDLDE
jgi:hypothetical protein